MKTTALLLLCKLLSRIGRLIGKGSSLPGRIALRLDPGILSRIRLPEYVAAVTGSNGKTSTVEMIAHVLRQSGRTVAYNREGSNQIEGIATVLSTTATGRAASAAILSCWKATNGSRGIPSAILRRPTTSSPTCTATSSRATGTPNGSTTSCGRASTTARG